MPFLNSQGRIAHGRLGFGACLDNVQFDTGGEACWYTDDTIVYIHDGSDGRYLAFYNINTATITPVDAAPRRNATVLMANRHSHWVAWYSSIGLYSDTGFNDLTATPKAIGPGGSIAYTVDGGVCKVREVTEREYELSPNPALKDVNILGDKQALWVEGSELMSLGMPTLAVVATVGSAGISQPKAVLMDGKWWLCYRSSTYSVVLHPYNNVDGYLLFSSPTGRFDMIALNPTTIRVAWGTGANEGAGETSFRDINILTEAVVVLGPKAEVSGDDPPEPAIDKDGMRTLTSTATYVVAGEAEEMVTLPIRVWPAYPVGGGKGRIVHPTLGTFDYEVKPDEWVNIDADAIISPVWASTRTLTSAANVLWDGNIKDVVVEERWKALGGLAMPATQLRMLLAIWTTPVDPDVGYVTWYPSYITQLGFKVLPVGLQSGGGGITFDDVINYKDENDDPIGWMTAPVTFTLKMVERL